MSATKSPTARRRSAEEYGARSAARTSGRSGARVSSTALRTKVAVRTHANSRSNRLRTSGIRSHGRAFAGSDTPVLARMIPAT